MVVTKKPGRRQRRRDATRERIFRAALDLFAERGVVATTVEDLTEAADVGKGTFFNYFPSKEHVLGGFGAMQLAKAHAVLAEQPGRTLRATLGRMVHALAEEPGRSPALVRSILAANLSSEPVRRLMLANLDRGRRELARALARAQKQGEVRRDRKAADLALYFQLSYFGAALYWAWHPGTSLTRRLDRTMDLFWEGVKRPE